MGKGHKENLLETFRGINHTIHYVHSCDKHFFSILIPSFRTPTNFLIEALDSVKIQTFKDFEVILCEQGEEDLSWIIELYPFVKIVHQDKPSLSLARITLLTNAEGKYVLFLDSDDRLSPDALYTLNKFILETHCGDKTVICYKCYRGEKPFFNTNREKINFVKYDKKDFIKEIAKSNDPFLTSASLKCFPRFIMQKVIDIGIFQGEDKFLSLQIAMNASCGILLDTVLYFYRISPSSGQILNYRSNIRDLSLFYWCASNLDFDQEILDYLFLLWINSYVSRTLLFLSNGGDLSDVKYVKSLPEYVFLFKQIKCRKKIIKKLACDRKSKVSILLFSLNLPLIFKLGSIVKKLFGL